MEWFEGLFAEGGYLPHLAALLAAIGLFSHDLLIQRLLLFVSTALFVIFFYMAQEQPFFGAVAWGLIIALSNLFIIAQIVLERTTFALSDREKELYTHLKAMNPGEFRRLLKITVWRDGDGEHAMTIEDQLNPNLYFVIEGVVHLSKGEHRFAVTDGGFIGEVSYLLGTQASGTATVDVGGRYVAWYGEDLSKLEKRDPGIRVALRDLINMDMARKVAQSVGTVEDPAPDTPVQSQATPDQSHLQKELFKETLDPNAAST